MPDITYLSCKSTPQDAIYKCLAIDEKERKAHGADTLWQVVHLPKDPRDDSVDAGVGSVAV